LRESAISLRPVTAADEPLLRTLFCGDRLEALRSAGLGEREAGQLLEFQYRAQAEQYEAAFPGAESSVIEVDGEPLGRLLVARRESEIRVVDIALLAGARGRGIGATVLRGLQDEAACSGRRLVLRVARGNPAQRLYERLGFTESAGEEMYVEMFWQARVRSPASNDIRKTTGAAP